LLNQKFKVNFMVLTEKELLEALVSNKVIIPAQGGRFAISTSLAKLIKVKDTEGKCLNYPEQFYGLSDAIIYKKVMDMCGVQLSHKNGQGKSYYVRTCTKESIAVLNKILKSTEIDFDVFVRTVFAVYSSDNMLPGFANFLTNGLWEEVYESGTQKESEDLNRDRKGII